MEKLCLKTCLIILLAVSAGCGTNQPRGGSREVTSLGQSASGVSQAEIQQDVQRFVGEFSDSVVQAMDPLLKSQNLEIHDRALRQALLYVTGTLDIASGPSPEVNLLDMIWFVRLNRLIIQNYWVPQVYGKKGEPLLATFERLEERIWRLASKVMSDDAKQKLVTLLDQWRRDNPQQVRVEFSRFSEVSRIAGKEAKVQAQEAGGLLRSVQAGVATADNAVLLAERSLFLVQRMPFLLRLQVQIASRDIVSDLGSLGNVEPLLGETTNLAVTMRDVARESRMLAQIVANDILPPKRNRRPGALLMTVNDFREGMASAEKVLGQTNALVNEMKSGSAANLTAPVSVALEDTDRMVRRWVLYFLILGAGWALFGWGGYYLAHHFSNNGRHRPSRREPHLRH